MTWGEGQPLHNKLHTFQCVGKIFCGEFQRYSAQNFTPIENTTTTPTPTPTSAPTSIHCGHVTPYDDIDLGHQAITWTNIDLSSVRSSDIHLTAIA